MNVYIETYGCASNKYDSEIMGGLLERAGFIIVNNPEIADIVIINTCAVKETTENKIFSRIKYFEKFGKKMLIAGCMPEAEYQKLRKITKASLMGIGAIPNIVKICDKITKNIVVEDFTRKKKIGLPKLHFSKIIDIVNISEGCMSNCSFCSTRFARGVLKSYKIPEISKYICMSKKSGFKEFWLTSQDCGCYGFDIGTNIAALLNNIIQNVSGKYFLRVGMMNPVHIKKIISELIEIYKDPHVFKFIHVPVQSGSDKILKKMNRGHTVNDFINIIKQFRAEIPDITVWTDIIVGFPSETEKDFEKSVELIKQTNPDFVNISRFSSRPGTDASKMKQLITEIKKERSKKMSSLIDNMAKEKNEKWLGWSGEVIVDEYNKKNNAWIGRNYAYKPVILNGKHNYGDIINVKIVDTIKTGLFGVYSKDRNQRNKSSN